jgi:heme/copper-type cytochrome/quinol oxidase subunit 2
LQERSIFARGTRVLGQWLVLLPIAILPFATAQLETKWDSSNDECIEHTPVWFGRIEMYLILVVCATFFVLFIGQMWQAHRNTLDELKDSFDPGMFDASYIKKIATSASLRNVIVVFFALVWMIVYYGPLNHDQSMDSKAFEFELYRDRIVLGFDQLTNNIVLYFVFRDWSFFLCYPFHKPDRKTICVPVEEIFDFSVNSTATESILKKIKADDHVER